MKILELFSGTGHISAAFRDRGHEAFRVDWSEKLDAELHTDISRLTSKDVIELCGGVPDVIWASPDCTTYSVAAIYHHRKKVNDVMLPKTEYAAWCDFANIHLWKLIKELLDQGTTYFFIENPRGGYRKSNFLDILPHTRHTITYCQYGNNNMKPTDIFTNHPNPKFLPMCSNGDPCHESARRRSKTGTQGKGYSWDRSKPGITRQLARGLMPEKLCSHIAKISEEGICQ